MSPSLSDTSDFVLVFISVFIAFNLLVYCLDIVIIVFTLGQYLFWASHVRNGNIHWIRVLALILIRITNTRCSFYSNVFYVPFQVLYLFISSSKHLSHSLNFGLNEECPYDLVQHFSVRQAHVALAVLQVLSKAGPCYHPLTNGEVEARPIDLVFVLCRLQQQHQQLCFIPLSDWPNLFLLGNDLLKCGNLLHLQNAFISICI